MPHARFRALGLLFAALAWLAWAEAASAQSITLDVPNITRREPVRQSLRWWINYEECLANDVFSFPITTPNTGPQVEVWAGNQDCAAIRGNVDRGQCWIVGSLTNPADETFRLEVPVRNIVARRTNTLTVPSNLPASVCEESMDSDGEQFTLYFIQQEGGRSVASTTWDASNVEGLGFDLVGPRPPGGISVGVGESQLTIRLSGIDEDNDRERFEAFCVPEGTVAELMDAGADASVAPGGTVTPDGGAAPPGCFTNVIRAGERPPPQFSCGVVRETSGTLRTSRLINDVDYAVGVAGQDRIGNAGVLSNIECGRPVPLDDFFELYIRNGGRGGGGICAVSAAGSSGASRLPFAALSLLALMLGWRRRGRVS